MLPQTLERHTLLDLNCAKMKTNVVQYNPQPNEVQKKLHLLKGNFVQNLAILSIIYYFWYAFEITLTYVAYAYSHFIITFKFSMPLTAHSLKGNMQGVDLPKDVSPTTWT